MKHRKNIIVGNWKMNTEVKSGINLAKQILDLSDNITNVEKIICPPFVSLTSIAKVLKGSSIQLGAQNVNANENGAFTGEVSTAMLHGLVSHVVLGHSERRMFYDESSDQVSEKAISASKAGITPILCVGEDFSVRKSGKAVNFITKQLEASLQGFSNWQSLIIAYEPIWAIGTGEAATSGQAQEMAAVCRDIICSLTPDFSNSVHILYGGSVNSTNVTNFLEQPDIDGALVGGASLNAQEFSNLIRLASSK
ncbi:MAG: triose-phosphate isomerase [SAR202 cluster bacterium]|nr:triose-phosphate isomerase [SAR202 cluster bacterium]|tara:strand:- start:8614 stop:9369 length:756 start_codon:yes stop_codon:yes gene_type:complete